MYEDLKELLIDAVKNEKPVYYEDIAPMFGLTMTATTTARKSVEFSTP